MPKQELGLLLILYVPLVIVALYTFFNRKDSKQR